MKNILTFLICLITFSGFSQNKISWKQHVKLADELYMKSLYEDAAEHYKSAWRKKPKKKELIAKAADCYYIIRDYKKAAGAFKHIKDERKDFPLAGLRYARSLKQSGKFDEANQEFVHYIERYNEDDKAIVDKIVRNEIKGCELGRKSQGNLPANVKIRHLGSQVNSPETEFAPIPYNENVLYYSSTMSNKARIYLTMRDENGVWSKGAIPKKNNFPQIRDKHFCNGSLSPDGKRFYFTLCESKENWGGLTTRCEINVIKNETGSWSAPEALPAHINRPETTSTHPYIVHEGGKEIMYFSSNRAGGQGGMDLWYCERSINSPSNNFSLPKNLGKNLNTIGDEITPFYHSEEGVLYFSSNNQPGIGGQDIFKTTGQRTSWSTPVNIGLPYNSTSDDYYFIKTPGTNNGFLSSNRVFGIEKIRTTHEDLFEFVTSDSSPIVASNKSSSTFETDTKKEEIQIETKPTPKVTIQPKIEEQPVPEENKPSKKRKAEYAETVPSVKKTEEPKDQNPAPEVQMKIIDPPPAANTPITTAIIEESTPYTRPNDEITEVRLSGKIVTPEAQSISNVALRLYKIIGTGGRQLVKNEFSKDGTFDFKLNPDKYYYIEAGKDGYSENSIEVFTGLGKYLNKNIIIEKTGEYEFSDTSENSSSNARVNTSPKSAVSETIIPTAPSEREIPTVETELVSPNSSSELNKYDGSTYVSRGQSKFDRSEYTTDASRHQGEYFKIQLVADHSFNPDDPKFAALNYLGKYDTEFLQKKRLHRVLLGDFFSLEEAKIILKTVQRNEFKRAFIVKYQDGQRFGMVYR